MARPVRVRSTNQYNTSIRKKAEKDDDEVRLEDRDTEDEGPLEGVTRG
jgi:hypothetical protein